MPHASELIGIVGEHAALFVKAAFEILASSGWSNSGFGRNVCTKSWRSRSVVRVPRCAEACTAACPPSDRRPPLAGSARSRVNPLLGFRDRMFVIGDADLHRLDLGAERRDWCVMAVGDSVLLAELAETKLVPVQSRLSARC